MNAPTTRTIDQLTGEHRPPTAFFDALAQADAHLAREADLTQIPALFDHTEYAIQLGDGTYHTGWDDYLGQFVMTWTDRAEAERERDRIRCCGITVSAEGVVVRDRQYCDARLVERYVASWRAAG